MAQTCGPVWVITTAGTVRPAADQVEIFSIVWTSQNTLSGSATATVTDAASRTIWSSISNCDRSTTYVRPVRANGLTVSALTHGTLLIQMD